MPRFSRRAAPTLMCVLALAACVTAPGSDEPQMTLAYRDIAPDAPDAPARMAQRVSHATAAYCDRHGAAMTPHHRRRDPGFCLSQMRAAVVRALPAAHRAAYEQGRRTGR